jgi:WD40 repeat protein
LTINASNPQDVQETPMHTAAVNVARIARDGHTLITGGADGIVRVSQRSTEPGTALKHSGEVIFAAISPDGSILATTSRQTSLRFWSLPDGKLLREISLPKTPWKLAFSPDGNWLSVGAWDRSIQLWNTRDMKRDINSIKHTMNLLGHTQLVTGQAFDSTSKLMASVSNDGTVRLWDVSGIEPSDDVVDNRRRCLATFDAHAGDEYAVTFPADRSIAVGQIDGTVRVWELDAFDRYINRHVDYQRTLRH